MDRWRSLRPLWSLAGQPALFGGRDRVRHLHSLASERVALPALRFGAAFLERMAVREVPEAGAWRAEGYESVSPALFAVDDALVHSAPGLLAVGGYVSPDSLDHTDPARHGYERQGYAVKLRASAVEEVPGVAVNLLAGGCGNVQHWLCSAVGRLGAVPADRLAEASVVLIPAEVSAVQRRLLDAMPLPPGMAVRAVGDGETLRVRRLLVPTSVSAEFRYHPCLRDTLRRALDRHPPDPGLPRRFYVDRRGAAARRLVNEDDLAAQLARQGIVPVALERLTLHQQVALFRSAELIVAPHGAGLANLVFAPPGCRVVEVLMDSYATWCFRNLAGLCGLDYDCVIGRTVGRWAELGPAVHGSAWTVSVPHVLAAAVPG